MKQLRRLDAGADNPFLRAQTYALRSISCDHEAFQTLQRERPELVVVENDGLLFADVGPGIANLQYGFRNTDAFAAHFPRMLEALFPAIDQRDAAMGLRLRLTDTSSRPFIEPTLLNLAFDVTRDWLRMTLPALPRRSSVSLFRAANKDEIAPGYVLRPARGDDAEAIAALDSAVFATSWLTAAVVRHRMADAPTFRVLEEVAAAGAIGFLRLAARESGEGYVSDIVLHPRHHRHGLGEAMMRWALAYFRSEGLKSAALTVNSDNGAAIALYRKLGFEAGATGLDYRRPLDEDEVRQTLEKRRTTYITTRRRF